MVVADLKEDGTVVAVGPYVPNVKILAETILRYSSF
jgi:hypothetical protein